MTFLQSKNEEARTGLMTASTFKKGFTLIELMVVIAVIGILAAIALVSLTGVQKTARDATRKSNIADYATALARYYTDNQTYPVSAVGGDVSNPAASGIFTAAGALVTGNYMAKALTDPNGGVNCKVSTAAAAQQCTYTYFGSAAGYEVSAILENPLTAGGVYYTNANGNTATVAAQCNSPTAGNCP
jgi:prepilin-type N-terminal cleavage/methylation domain-containing protein